MTSRWYVRNYDMSETMICQNNGSGWGSLEENIFLCLKHAHCYCWIEQGLVNVLIEHHPTIGDIITNKYLKVMLQISKTGDLPTPESSLRR